MKLLKKEHLRAEEAEALLSRVDDVVLLEKIIALLKYKCLFSEEEILGIFKRHGPADAIEIPLSIFGNGKYSALEAITKFLREDKGLKYSEISRLIGRDQRTVWVTYNNSRKKAATALEIAPSEYRFPLTALKSRRLSILESIVVHVRDRYGLGYTEIARLIKRDPRNVWAMYSRGRRKQHGN